MAAFMRYFYALLRYGAEFSDMRGEERNFRMQSF
jgi:hypothetical protein